MKTASLTRAALILIGALVAPASAAAQESPLSSHTRFMYAGVKAILVRSAEKMPEEQYGFKPTEAVRSFGQIIGHVTDWQYRYCSTVLGEQNPSKGSAEKTVSTKAELIDGLKTALAY